MGELYQESPYGYSLEEDHVSTYHVDCLSLLTDTDIRKYIYFFWPHSILPTPKSVCEARLGAGIRLGLVAPP